MKTPIIQLILVVLLGSAAFIHATDIEKLPDMPAHLLGRWITIPVEGREKGQGRHIITAKTNAFTLNANMPNEYDSQITLVAKTHHNGKSGWIITLKNGVIFVVIPYEGNYALKIQMIDEEGRDQQLWMGLLKIDQ